MNNYERYADWQVDKDRGICTRIMDAKDVDLKKIPPLKNIFKQSDSLHAQCPVIWCKDNQELGDLEKCTGLFVKANFWTLTDAFILLDSAIKNLPDGSDIVIFLPLLRGRGSGASFDKSQLKSWPFAHAFTWQTIFSVFHDMGLRKMWRENCESQSAGIYYFTAKTSVPPTRHMLSVVMPVVNEKSTFLKTFDRVYKKVSSMEHIDFELIIIESNSTDGTKELVASKTDIECVSVIWQDRPQGKGFAAREGIENATGTIILIQDADDEYDVEDYDVLIDAIVAGKAPFLLGARDTSDWRMRAFHSAGFRSFLYNAGHIFFTGFLNFLVNTKMKDPFTMYKVFLRDCVSGLGFICKRFDFDHELVIKLVRKGFVPPEYVVSYKSRSHEEGKKVSILKDGLFWISTDLKLRLSKLKPKL